LDNQTVLLEDLAMAAFIVSSFGLFVMGLFAGLFTTPSEQTFTVLAYGWAVASGERQTITTYLWLTGATSVKHFSCFYRFLGGALYEARWQVWARIIRCAAQWVPAEAVIVLLVDDSTKKKAGRQIEGVGHYRHGAGSARQEYRTLRGLNFVWGQMRVPVPGWLGISFAVFAWGCHGNGASSKIVDCTVNYFCWRTLSWLHSSSHPLGSLSGAYCTDSSLRRRGKRFSCWLGAGPWPASATPSLPICGLLGLRP
jgi:hypothetical protein